MRIRIIKIKIKIVQVHINYIRGWEMPVEVLTIKITIQQKASWDSIDRTLT